MKTNSALFSTRPASTRVFGLALTAVTLALVTPRVSGADDDKGDVARIRDEGMNHSQVMQTLSYLADVIGPRLTGSPAMKRANEWTRERLAGWGLSNAHLEAWGPFGRGWEVKRFSAQIIEPQDIPLRAYPEAWSPGFKKALEAPVVYLDTTNVEGLEKYAGKLKGAVVLPLPPRPAPFRTNALVERLDDAALLELADAGPPSRNRPGAFGGPGGVRRRGTNAPAFRRRGPSWTRFLPFLIKEKAALVAIPGSGGDGVFVVQSASVPLPGRGTNESFRRGSFGPGANRPSAYSTNAPEIPAEMAVAVEDYDRMVRMIQQGLKLKMAVDLKVKFYQDDLMSYNTVAEIPGTDLRDQVVMVGGHMDSWHSATGATDNGAGVAAAMEAVRIIKALDLHPRRTIRVALWSGEEEGLFGSRAYVTRHFGYYTNAAEATGRDQKEELSANGDDEAPRRVLVKEAEYDKLSVYFNLDNGAGRIRGVYMQGNEAARPYFQKWLAPFRDLGAETLTLSNTGSTDHISFDNIGLPGFQFIQDPLDYEAVTHHTTQDLYDRVPPEDLKQAATIMAAMVYEASMMDERFPRKTAD